MRVWQQLCAAEGWDAALYLHIFYSLYIISIHASVQQMHELSMQWKLHISVVFKLGVIEQTLLCEMENQLQVPAIA